MGIELDLAAIRTAGKGLTRPEGVVSTLCGEIYAGNARGHVSVIAPDGSQWAFGQLGGRPNGIAFDAAGALIVANIGAGELQYLTPDGKHTVLASEASGQRMSSPNFPVVDCRGRIWCSNSCSRLDLLEALKDPRADGCVFCVDGDRREIVAEGLMFANGLALDEKEEYLYVAETTAHRISRFQVTADGACVEREQYGPLLGEHGQPDGIAFDTAGNLWVTLVNENSIGIIYPDGSFETVLNDPSGHLLRRPSNLCFGGPDLRTACIGSLDGSTIPCFTAPFPGLPLVHQLSSQTAVDHQ